MEPVLQLLSDAGGNMAWAFKPGADIQTAQVVLMLEKLKLDLLQDLKDDEAKKKNGVQQGDAGLLNRLKRRQEGCG